MKSLSVGVFFMALCLTGGSAWADGKQDILAVAEKIVAEDKTRFGIDVKKCRLECQRVYSKEHCIDKCTEISNQLRAEAFQREAEEKIRMEEEKPLKYKEVAEKYQ
ncbi:MAG: hypothetical protein ABH891_03340 [Candidatus Omnitrophota bacterium]